VLYNAFKKCVSIFFNTLNALMGGNLPPFGCVSAVVEEQDRYLVVELPNGHITLPGGFMRWGEHPRQAAKREALEETGYLLEVGDLIGCYSCVSHKADRMSTITMAFHAKVVGGEPRGSIEGQPRWIDEQALHERLTSHCRGIFNDYLRSRTQRNVPNASPFVVPNQSCSLPGEFFIGDG
jgi:ADP-ribose pyrophosphatase YjhB (NUDIX family)